MGIPPAARNIPRAFAGLLAVAWALAAPAARGDERFLRPHPALENVPRVTTTSRGRPGDALNVALEGSEEDLHRALAAAGWYAADPITLETSVRIAADVVLAKPYPHAPVSDLFLFGRR